VNGSALTDAHYFAHLCAETRFRLQEVRLRSRRHHPTYRSARCAWTTSSSQSLCRVDTLGERVWHSIHSPRPHHGPECVDVRPPTATHCCLLDSTLYLSTAVPASHMHVLCRACNSAKAGSGACPRPWPLRASACCRPADTRAFARACRASACCSFRCESCVSYWFSYVIKTARGGKLRCPAGCGQACQGFPSVSVHLRSHIVSLLGEER
jgi:hypothetical protein